MKIVTLLFCLVFSYSIHAQKTLTEEDKKVNMQRAKEYLNEFEVLVTRLSAGKLTESQKESQISNVLSRFEDSAVVEVSNLKNEIHEYPLKKYFYKVVAKYPKDYGVVIMKFSFVDQSNLSPVKDKATGKLLYYEGDMDFRQCFYATKKSSILKLNDEQIQKCEGGYCDCTVKNVKIKVVPRYEELAGQRWKVYLSDISVTETKEYK
ncbi:MAG: hypothetical protein NTX03_09335 [Bacteroidetes bacterium]|nr:hypothetical protein [Bacteroidota bacterium]